MRTNTKIYVRDVELEKAIKNSGLKLSVISRMIGCSPMSLWNWTRGRRKLSEEFKGSIVDIITGEKQGPLSLSKGGRPKNYKET